MLSGLGRHAVAALTIGVPGLDRRSADCRQGRDVTAVQEFLKATNQGSARSIFHPTAYAPHNWRASSLPLYPSDLSSSSGKRQFCQ